MAGTTKVTLTGAVSYRGRVHTAGESVDVDADTETRWQRLGVVEAAVAAAPTPPPAPPVDTPPHVFPLEGVAGINARAAEALDALGIATVEALQALTDEDLKSVPGIGDGTVRRIREFDAGDRSGDATKPQE